MSVPYWVQDAVFYQIFPDRFANGDQSNDPVNMQAWGAPPTAWGFQGGDLRGIIEKLDYLLDLGVNAIYLNPIFASPSNHRYNTYDYYQIDPRLGTRKDFQSLLDAVHANGMRLILDGVFNHCSRGFFPFVDVLENHENSAYRNWFHINRLPVNAYGAGNAEDYQGWWGYKSLPKFNTHNPAVRKYLFDVARFWIEQGVDGWRLDVPNEIDDDSFWAEFRQVVKMTNPEAYLLGEIWTADPRWVGEQHFDGLMNYPMREALLEWLQSGLIGATAFLERIEKILKLYARENVFAMYLPLGSHDTERLRTALGGDLNKVKLGLGFQFAFPGAPAIYYGDEIGLKGGKDPECRGAFPWNADAWQVELRRWVQRLVWLRKRIPALRRGDYRRLLVDERRQCCVFARSLGDQAVVVALNAGSTLRHVRIPVSVLGWGDGLIVHNLLGPGEYVVAGDGMQVTLPPWSCTWISNT